MAGSVLLAAKAAGNSGAPPPAMVLIIQLLKPHPYGINDSLVQVVK